MHKKYKMHNRKDMSCKGCVYTVRLGNDWYCDYFLTTKRCRPCPPGEACTVRRDGKRKAERI